MAKREELFVNVSVFPNGVTHRQGAAAPTTGTSKRGDIVWNTAPTAGGNGVGWICTTAGINGSTSTWKTFGAITA